MLRERFIEHVFCRHRWSLLVRRGLTRRALVEFHTAHKLLLQAHNETGYRRLGRIVAGAGTVPEHELFSSYEAEFHDTLNHKATAKRHTSVLYHGLEYFTQVLAPAILTSRS